MSHSIPSEQLHLPLEIREKQEVSWEHVMLTEKRKFLFWKTVVARAIREEGTYRPATSTIDAENIADLKDVNLRYALRFATAADAMGMIPDDPWSSHGHFVVVRATDEGVNSQFVDAVYTGVDHGEQDTFLADIRSFATPTNEDY